MNAGRILCRLVLPLFLNGLSPAAMAQQEPTTQQSGESMMLNWPNSENWSLGSNQSGKRVNIIQLVHKPETVDNWTEMASMISISSMVPVPLQMSMDGIYRETKKVTPTAKLTVIDKDTVAEYPWILFTIESGKSKANPNGESQIYYDVRGKRTLYVNSWAIKAPTLTEEQKQKWGDFFKTGRVVTK